MSNPYTALPSKAFWRSAIADVSPFLISDLWIPKHQLRRSDKIATFGSCFAQHFAGAIKARGYTWLDAERPPSFFSPDVCKTYNYSVFSARTGNIYTTRALKQWIFWSLGLAEVPEEIWEKDGRFYDPFRPAIEPHGFATKDELLACRRATLAALARIVVEADRFVFTLGLTEAWNNKAGGYEYAMCPGTVAGKFDVAHHSFVNHNFSDIRQDLADALEAILARNKKLRVILTVSPVPLTATASGKHVLEATTYSKSVLRAVAGQLADHRLAIDYFPSYEIIASTPFGGMFFEPNKRSVSQAGVDFVMDSFFDCLDSKFGMAPRGGPVPKATPTPKPLPPKAPRENLVCEEEMLAVFGAPVERVS